MFNNIKFHFTSATILAIVGAALACAVVFGLKLKPENVQSIMTLVGLILGGIVVGGGFKSRGLIRAGLNEKGQALRAGAGQVAGLGLHFTSATILAIVGAGLAMAVSFGLDMNQVKINALMKLLGLVFAGITFGGGVKSSGMLEAGVHPALLGTTGSTTAPTTGSSGRKAH